MRFVLIFLSALVVITQQFYLQRSNVPMVWLASPYSPNRFINNYHRLEDDHQDAISLQHQLIPSRSSLYFKNESPRLTVAPENLNNTENFPDTKSRIRGFSVHRPSKNNNQSGRFLLNDFNNGVYHSNPFLRTFTTTSTSTSTSIKTATSTTTSTSVSVSTSTAVITSISLTTSTNTAVITNTATLSLISVVKCVPSFQVSPVPVSCGRKRREIDDDGISEEHLQFVISPSETLNLVPTVLPSETIEQRLPAEHLTSSKDETEISKEEQKRSKRFFLNRFQFSILTAIETTTSTTTSILTSVVTSIIVVPTTTTTQSVSTLTASTTSALTSYLFLNSTITQTVNLINPAPTKQCLAAAAAAGDVVCVACLPMGYVVCK